MAGPRKNLKFLSEGEVIAINEEMVAQFGGLHGVKDSHMLSLAVGRPQMSVGFQDAYKTIFDKAAALFHSIINNHPFLDGNKRTSLFSAVLFLEYNDRKIEFKRKEAVKFTRRAHNQDYTVEQISSWLKDHCAGERS